MDRVLEVTMLNSVAVLRINKVVLTCFFVKPTFIPIRFLNCILNEFSKHHQVLINWQRLKLSCFSNLSFEQKFNHTKCHTSVVCERLNMSAFLWRMTGYYLSCCYLLVIIFTPTTLYLIHSAIQSIQSIISNKRFSYHGNTIETLQILVLKKNIHVQLYLPLNYLWS